MGQVLADTGASRASVDPLVTRGLVEVVADSVTGDLVPPGDAGHLARGIVRLLEDRDRRERYGREGLSRAQERFPLEKMVRGWTRIYRDLLASRGRREAA